MRYAGPRMCFFSSHNNYQAFHSSINRMDRAQFYKEVYSITKEIPYGNVFYLRKKQHNLQVIPNIHEWQDRLYLMHQKKETSLSPGSKQPRKIGSQLDGTKGTAGKRRHRFQKERVRGLKKHIGRRYCPLLRYVTPSQSSLSPKSISTPLSIQITR